MSVNFAAKISQQPGQALCPEVMYGLGEVLDIAFLLIVN
jgi:hypothetical protein